MWWFSTVNNISVTIPRKKRKTVYKTLQRKLNIEKNEPSFKKNQNKTGVISGPPEVYAGSDPHLATIVLPFVKTRWCCSIFTFLCSVFSTNICVFVLFLLPIVLSVLPITVFDFHFRYLQTVLPNYCT